MANAHEDAQRRINELKEVSQAQDESQQNYYEETALEVRISSIPFFFGLQNPEWRSVGAVVRGVSVLRLGKWFEARRCSRFAENHSLYD